MRTSSVCTICGEPIIYKGGFLHSHEFKIKKLLHYLIRHKKWIFTFKGMINMILVTFIGYPMACIYVGFKLILYPFWWMFENL